MKTKMFTPFELKNLSDSGEFTGTASPYGVLDLGQDIVEPGAFNKTISDHGNKVRLLDGHQLRIGIANVKDAGYGLEMHGKINLNKDAGRDAYSDLKFYRDNDFPMGLSIGYETIKADTDQKGIRHLKEVRLWEISITEFPMNPSAEVRSVKTVHDNGTDEGQTPSGTLDGAADKSTPELKAAEIVEPAQDHSTEEIKGKIESIRALIPK